MARKSARRIALEDQILALLHECQHPLSTAAIAERIGLHRTDNRCWRLLRDFELAGNLTCHRDRALRTVYWSIRRENDPPPPGPHLVYYGKHPQEIFRQPVVCTHCGNPLADGEHTPCRRCRQTLCQ